MRLNLISVSGGKDSTATWLYALETESRDTVQAVFADTGNEHEITYQYLDYLEGRLGNIVRLRRDFSEEWEHRRQWLMSEAPRKDRADRKAYSEAEIARVLAVFERAPTGNPYLDLCIIKGRFPTRRAQFCTQFLKTEPLVEYQLQALKRADAVWSWQGIRREEGGRRAYAKEFEEVGGGIYIYRPILSWKAADCFDAMHVAGIEPNPLYKMGMSRVGCMPRINAAKGEINEIARRFPEHIDRIEEWEAAVVAGSWHGRASFFPAPEDGRAERVGRNIRQVVQWAKTARGGKQFDLLKSASADACSSAYGLCE